MAISTLTDPAIRHIASTFATEFKRQGLFGGGSTSNNEDIKKDRGEAKTQREVKKEHAAALKQAERLRKAASLLETKYKNTANAAQRAADARKKASVIEYKAGYKYRQQLNRLSEKALPRLITAAKTASDKLRSFGFAFAPAIALLSTAFGKAANDFRAQLKQGAIDTGSVFDQMHRALQLGVDPELLSELQAQNRAAVLAMGGVENWSNQLVQSNRTLYTYFGDLDETIRFTSQSLQTMRLAGIDPTIQMLMNSQGELQGFGKSIRNIHMMTGKSFHEINEMLRGFIETDEVRFRLASTLDQKRRQQIIEEIAQRHEMLVGLGMTAEQAQRAAQRLDQLAGKGPRERMKEAAQARAMFGMMGMAGEGEEVQRLIVLGQRRNEVQNERLAELLKQAQQKAAESVTGPLSREMTVMTAYQRLGMDQYKDFLVVASDEAVAQQDAARNLKTVGEANETLVDTAHVVTKWLKNFKDNPMMVALLAGISALGTIARMILARMALGGGLGRSLRIGKMGKMGRLGNGLFGGGARGIRGAARGIGGGAVILGGITATIEAATAMWNESTADSAKRAANLFGKAGESFLGDLGNRTVSAFRHIGQNLLGYLGINADEVGGAIGKSIYNFLHDTPSKELPSQIARREKMQERAMAWAKDAGRMNREGQFTAKQGELQAELAAAFMNIATRGGALYDPTTAINPQLNDIRILLKELGISNEQAQLLTKEQIALMAQMAADGQITAKEQRTMTTIMKTMDWDLQPQI